MKIYVMRHCERNMNDCGFESPLIYEGQMNAKNKYNELNRLNINVIYSSPFLRTIQTGDFYSKMKNIPINIDYSIAEYISPQDRINMHSINNYIIPERWKHNFNLNCNKMLKDNFNLDEKLNDSILRVYLFLQDLKKKYQNTDKNILIITHKSITNIIIGLQNSFYNIKNINNYIENEYPMGKITQLN